jgi:signal transduction histidine kinase/CheY-like chemotaxis protein
MESIKMKEPVQRGKKILILDDNPVALTAIRYNLKEAFEEAIIETETLPKEAYRQLQVSSRSGMPFTFFVTDLQFRDGSVEDGIRSISQVRRDHPELKVIAITGKDSQGAPALDAGAFAFFRKPHYGGLVDAIRFSEEILHLERSLCTSQAGDIFKHVMDILPMGISIVDRRMRVFYVNETQLQMCDLMDSPEGRPGHICYEMFAKGAVDVCPDCPVVRVFENPTAVGKSATHMRGKGRHHRVTALPLRVKGKVVAAVKIVYDMTTREEFEIFRKGLAGELTLSRRIPMVLKAVAARGFKRSRILLLTDDRKFIESYRLRGNELGDFWGHLQSVESVEPMLEVLRRRRPMRFIRSDPSHTACWFWHDPGDQDIGCEIEYGLVPMTYMDQVIGAVYVDNYEPRSSDLDITRSPLPITLERLQDLIGFANEAAKAIVESQNMEMARQGLKLLQSDIELLQESNISELLQTLLDKCIEFIREQPKRRIVRRDVADLSGEVRRVEGVRLVKKSADFDIRGNTPRVWNVEKDTKSLPVKVFRTREEMIFNNLADAESSAEFFESFDGQPWAGPEYVAYQKDLRSYGCFPIKVQEQVVGTLALQSGMVQLFDDITLHVIRALVNRTSQAMARHLQVERGNRIVEMYRSMALAKSRSDEKDKDRTIFAFLTGLTHKEGLGFNRAIYLERNGDLFQEAYAIGPTDREQGEKLYDSFSKTVVPSIEQSLNQPVCFNSEPYYIPPIPVPALVLAVERYGRGKALPDTLFDTLECEEVYCLPLVNGGEMMAAVLLDNFITGKRIVETKMEILRAISLDYSTLLRNHEMIRILDDAARKDELLHILSHRLRSDLGAPSAFITSRLAKGKILTAEELTAIAKKMWTTQTVISDVLRFTEIERGNLLAYAAFATHKIEKVIRNAVDTVLPFGAERVKMDIRYPGNVWADEGHLLHLLINLLDNAVLYSAKDSPIEIRVEDFHGRLPGVQTTVTNLPLEPVDDEELARMFEKYFRGKNARFAKGTGLGLYIAQHVARIHRGSLVASRLDDGRICFVLFIPSQEPQ